MRNKLFLSFSLMLMFVSTQLIAASSDNGKVLFQSHCSACHNVNQRLVGPALQNIDKKQSESWIISFVHSPSKKIASGDTAAANIYKNFQPVMMPDQADLKDNDVRDIVAYIKSQSQPILVTPTANTPVSQPITFESYYVWCGVATILVMLIAIFRVLTNAASVKRQYLRR